MLSKSAEKQYSSTCSFQFACCETSNNARKQIKRTSKWRVEHTLGLGDDESYLYTLIMLLVYGDKVKTV